ncbi:2,4-dienoyl-CoA reductase [NADPH] (EC [Olavius algarvensis associated proteobacterium Delta 3]|nr:2,4-dienoyl-CoA reductase [NADPH] (EC [Olavius algarvensis associated proteobacterium Delta 3]CAB5168981.1 2,4-dienoyl-CoA reductase [NADPH] (EC [Olavius algarvensis associated proteobacterium Delta 3]
MSAFKHLFQSISIGSLKVKNRLLMSAMSINFGVDDQGWVDDQLIEYFRVRARGGVGMMLVGGGGVHPSGVELPHLPALWDDACIPSLTRMVNAVRPYETRFGVQLMHGGRQSYHDQKVAPSAIPAPAVVNGVPKALTLMEIDEIVAAFGDAARRCLEAGFDFIEIHGAHGYLINQFLSPNSNIREDAYGGPFDNRIRFLRDIMRDIRTKTGTDFPVGIRINGDDYIDGGWTLADAKRLAPILEAEGAAYLHVSAGVYGSRQLTIPSMYVPQGCFVHLAEAVKPLVSVPVITAGRIKLPEMAERIIRGGQADMVAMGRSLLADPNWPHKARTGITDTIRPCIGCCLACIHAVLALEPGSCVVNPEVGREYLLGDPVPAPASKKVMVIGAGPAGLAAARMAALRGHQVLVLDEKRHAGGLARLAALPPGRGEIMDLVNFLEREVARLGVEIRLNTPVDARIITVEMPDVAILASGSMPEVPLYKGLFQSRMNVVTMLEVLEENAAVGGKAIVMGGNQAGLVVADHLAEQGCDVVVLHRKAHFAEEMSSNDRFYLRERLTAHPVTLFKKVSIKRFFPHGVSFLSNGRPLEIDGFDTVVVSDAMTSIKKPLELFKDRAVDVHVIGDAKSPRTIQFAVGEAEEIGRQI